MAIIKSSCADLILPVRGLMKTPSPARQDSQAGSVQRTADTGYELCGDGVRWQESCFLVSVCIETHRYAPLCWYVLGTHVKPVVQVKISAGDPPCSFAWLGSFYETFSLLGWWECNRCAITQARSGTAWIKPTYCYRLESLRKVFKSSSIFFFFKVWRKGVVTQCSCWKFHMKRLNLPW